MKNTYLKMTAVALTACVGLAATTQTALAQPAVDADFGTLVDQGCSTAWTTLNSSPTAAGAYIRWLKFTLPAGNNVTAGGIMYLDMDTDGAGTTVTDTEMGVYSSTGARINNDDDDGVGAHSALSFGNTTVRASLPAPDVAYNGRDTGTLNAGQTYYIAVGAYNVTFNATAYSVTTDSTATGGVIGVRIRYGSISTISTTGTPTPVANLGTLTADGNFVTTPVSFDASNQFRWVKFTLGSGIDTNANRSYLDIDTEGSPALASGLTATQIALYDSAGARKVVDTVDGTDSLSQISYGWTTGRTAPGNGLAYNGRDGATLAAGDYWVLVSPTIVTTATTNWGASYGSCTTPIAGNAQVRVRTGSVPLPPAPTLQPGGDLGDIGACPTTFTGTLAAAEVKWYKFNLLVNVPAGGTNFVDITTAGSSLTPNSFGPNDTFIALYNGTTAKVVATDDDDGPGLTSALSFGNTSAPRTADGDGVAYNGRDGALTAGTYYFAAAAYPVTYTADYGAVSTSAVTGTWVCRIRYGDTAITGGSAPTVFTNLGTIPLDGSTTTGSTAITAPSTVKWFKITIPAIAAASRQYLDLDTETSGMLTASLGVYDSTGAIKASDSGSGSGDYSKVSFGFGGRPAVGDGTPYAGGADLTAGDYYVAVSAGGSAYNASFNVTACASTLGAIKLNVRAGVQPIVLPTADYSFSFGALSSCSITALNSPGEAIGAGGTKWYKITIPAIDRALNQYIDIDTNGSVISGGSFTNDTEIGLYGATGGAVIASDDESGDVSCSALSFGATSPTRTSSATTFAGVNGATLAAGDYYLAVSEYNQAQGADYAVTSSGTGTGTVTVRVAVGQFGATTTGTPASFTDLGTLVADGNFVTQNFNLAAQEVKWFTFTTGAIDSATRTYLDLDTEGSTGVTATALAVYDSTGAIKTTDLTDGTDSLSQISYGFATGRPAPGNGLAYNGRDGSTLAAGTYWVAVSSSTASFLANWGNANCGTASGAAKLNIRTGVAPPPAPPANAIDLGVVRSVPDTNNPGQFLPGSKTSGDITITGSGSASPVTWVKFQTKKPTSASTYYVDVHTAGSALTGTPSGTPADNDTEVGVYNSLGTLVSSNDDYTFTPTTVRESGLSWGLTTPTRTYGPVTPVDGRTGAVLAAGTYYAAFGVFNMEFNAEYGAVRSSTNVVTGTAKVTVVSNLPPYCNDADVASIGSGVGGGADGQNTVDDIIGFLGEFFANNVAVADLISLGGGLPAQPDGQVTVDDLIYFLNQFFAPCVP